jgi:hypothetical protein
MDQGFWTLVHFFGIMKNLKALIMVSALCVLVGTALFAETNPKITATPAKILHLGHVELRGTGFSPKSNVRSHLRRPNGTEFPVLAIYTNDKGEFVHDIDTVVMTTGVYELWAEDVKTNTTSNVARFELTMNSKDLEKWFTDCFALSGSHSLRYLRDLPPNDQRRCGRR